jgi:ketosteroid isomerase-like protein/predicted alpha/beta hydrolase family esterase
MSVEKDKKAIREVVASWARATAEGDLAAVMKLMTDDVVFLTPGNPPMSRKGFRTGFENMIRNVTVQAKLAQTMSEHMKKEILFVQGGGKRVHDTWDNKLVESLRRELGRDYTVRYPSVPNEADPHYDTWKPKLLSEIDDLEDGAIIVAHSIGAAILINLLAKEQPKRKLDAVVLISAPFLGEGGWLADEVNPPSKLGEHLPHVPMFFYQGTADKTVPPDHLKLYAKAVPQATIRELADRNHQLNDDLSVVARDIISLNEQAHKCPDVQGLDITVDGDLAMSWGKLEIEIKPKSGGPAKTAQGYTLSGFRRGVDGRWRIFRDANMLSAFKG